MMPNNPVMTNQSPTKILKNFGNAITRIPNKKVMIAPINPAMTNIAMRKQQTYTNISISMLHYVMLAVELGLVLLSGYILLQKANRQVLAVCG